MAHYFIIYAYFIIFFTLFCHILRVSRISLAVSSVSSVVRVVTPSGVDPSQASRGECWRLFAILADGGSLNKNTLDYEIVPADGVEPPFEPCRARDGVWVISSFSLPRNNISDHAARCRVLHTSRVDHRMSLQ